MLIERMPETIAWSGDRSALEQVHTAYLELLLQAFQQQLASAEYAEVVQPILSLCKQVSDQAFQRFLSAPETSWRLLWRGSNPQERAGFFLRSLEAEAAREGHPISFPRPTWSAVGDICFFPDGQHLEWPQIDGVMPLDFGSQRAARIDLTGQAFAAQQPNDPYSDQELSVVGMKLAEALTGVRQVSPLVADFTTDFTKVLVLQKDHTAPDHCSSGSHGQFIGRSFVTNLQSTDVTPSAIADAVIHESIHALLYMQQCMQPWGPDELIYDQTPRVNSPWTGRPLPLRSFIEASFVWFALAHFWAYALSKPTFDLQQSRALLSRAVVGFLHTPLPDLLGDARGHLLPALVESVATMQERIQAAWGSP